MKSGVAVPGSNVPSAPSVITAASRSAIFIKSCYDLSKPENSESGDSWFGLGPPLVIGVGFLVLGAILMVLWRIEHKTFFRRRPEVYGDPLQGPTVTE